MNKFNVDDLKNLQKEPKNIRNISILAHVDHGKTTIADYLVASNGIISGRLAGKLRYLDSREDEQVRGITMKSSSIALGFRDENQNFVINVIDSPGHVDFSGEVITAVSLCDGALIVVDVIEGVCSQTRAALKQAWTEKLKCVLILNKIDRLMIEQKLTPLDAYIRLQQVLEQINAYMGELFTSKALQQSSDVTEAKESESNEYQWSSGLEDLDDSDVYFSPCENNVVFGAAIDGWGFTIESFSSYLSKKTGVSQSVLQKTLWGDYYMNSKLKKIMRGAQSKAKKPLFVSMVLENLWSVYENVFVRSDSIMVEKIVNSLNIQLTKRDLNHTDARVKLKAVFSQWLPLSSVILRTVCKIIPNPLEITDERVERLISSKYTSLVEESKELKEAVKSCSSKPEAPVVAFVSKMFSVDKKSLPENRQKPLTAEEIALRRERIKLNLNNGTLGQGEGLIMPFEHIGTSEEEEEKDTFVAFARVYSGSLKKGDTVYVLGPKHDPSKVSGDFVVDPSKTLHDLQADEHATLARISQLYTLMGRELETCDEVCAGNIVGIGGLEEHIVKSATLSSSLHCYPFFNFLGALQPILRVALEPQSPADMAKLKKGLKLLNQADPCVEVKIQESGEHVIVTTGEVHLERCIADLQERFAKILLNVSEPIVPFRETIVLPPKLDMVNEKIENNVQNSSESEKNKCVSIMTPNKRCQITMQAVPLSCEVTKYLEDHEESIKLLMQIRQTKKSNRLTADYELILQTLKKELTDQINGCEEDSISIDVDKILAFGPKHSGPNILLNMCEGYTRPSLWDIEAASTDYYLEQYDHCLLNGFQLATLAGPLCEEPMTGVCFILKQWNFSEETAGSESSPYGPFTGQIMSAVKDCCRKAFQAQPQRLMAAMYSCNIDVTSDVLGKMYAVIGRRHGRILHGDMLEGSQVFTVTAVLPVMESFNFSNEIRKQTSGMAAPQLVFSHWELIDIDPFWVPTTEEEYLLYGEKADTENRARRYVNQVRRRKGLPVDQKIVEHAEKQRTLTKNK